MRTFWQSKSSLTVRQREYSKRLGGGLWNYSVKRQKYSVGEHHLISLLLLKPVRVR